MDHQVGQQCSCTQLLRALVAPYLDLLSWFYSGVLDSGGWFCTLDRTGNCRTRINQIISSQFYDFYDLL